MKMFCISDDLDIAVGLKLTGIKSIILNEKIDYKPVKGIYSSRGDAG